MEHTKTYEQEQAEALAATQKRIARDASRSAIDNSERRIQGIDAMIAEHAKTAKQLDAIEKVAVDLDDALNVGGVAIRTAILARCESAQKFLTQQTARL